MPREKNEYRDNLEALIARYPDKMLLSTKDVARYCGIDPRTAKKLYDIDRAGITIPTLARRMCR